MTISKHYISGFNESKANNILQTFLESKNNIKCFFKENDKTPNYDGSFELINKENIPQKQFIVQIKKVENMVKETEGKNKGLYVYELETNFLEYVKNKVTESPAIYFVVDIVTKNIFYLYLSDSVLMSLNFEGKEKIRYKFSDNNIIKNIDTFYRELIEIIKYRNRKFVYKSRDERENIQRALDGFNNELLFIKKHMFPDLWRFSVANSNNVNMSLMFHDEKQKEAKISSGKTSCFSLLPQRYGDSLIDVAEFDYNGLFVNYDFSGLSTPKSYLDDCLKKIVETYMDYEYISPEYLPDIVLHEIIFSFLDKVSSLSDRWKNDVQILMYKENSETIDKVESILNMLLSYFEHILTSKTLTINEQRMRNNLFNIIRRQRRFRGVDLIDQISCSLCLNDFNVFIDKENNEFQFDENILNLTRTFYKFIRETIIEAKKRNIKVFNRVWNYFEKKSSLENYNCFHVSKLYDRNKLLNSVDKWFEMLPDLYNIFYSKIFETKKYLINGRYEYMIKEEDDDLIILMNKYKKEGISFIKNDKISGFIGRSTQSEYVIEYSSNSIFPYEVFKEELLLYYSMKLLLSKGINEYHSFKSFGVLVSYSKINFF